MSFLGIGAKESFVKDHVAPYIAQAEKAGNVAAASSSAAGAAAAAAASPINPNATSVAEVRAAAGLPTTTPVAPVNGMLDMGDPASSIASSAPVAPPAPMAPAKPATSTGTAAALGVTNKVADQSIKSSGGSGGGSSGNPLKFDSFEILGIKENNYFEYVPIIFKSIKILGEGPEDDMKSLHIRLPLNPSKISDQVSVSFKRRLENTAAAAAANILAGSFSDIIPDSISKILLYEYDTSSLRKEVNIPYIIPVTGIMGNVQAIADIRRGLNLLQGMVYPRKSGIAYPPHLALTIGGMYMRLKGFISSVSVEFDENVTTIGGVKFPLLITGSITFTCLQAFAWDKMSLAGKDLFGEYGNELVLKGKALLFGLDNAGGGGGGSSSVPGNVTGNLDSMNPLSQLTNNGAMADQIKKAQGMTGLNAGALKDFNAEGIMGKLGEQQGLMDSMKGLDLKNLDLKELDLGNLPMGDLANMQGLQASLGANLGNIPGLDSLGINVNTDAISQAAGKVGESLAKLGTSANVGDFLGKLQGSTIIGDLQGVVGAVSSTFIDNIGNVVGGLSNVVKSNINILGPTLGKVGIDVNKAFDFSSSIDGALSQITSTVTNVVGSTSKEVNSLLNTISLADNMRINNAMSAVDKIIGTNVDILKTAKGNPVLETLAKIQASSNTLAAANVATKVADIQKQSTKAVFEKTQIDFMNNKIDHNVKQQAEAAMAAMSSIMPKSMSSSINAVHGKLGSFLNAFS